MSSFLLYRNDLFLFQRFFPNDACEYCTFEFGTNQQQQQQQCGIFWLPTCLVVWRCCCCCYYILDTRWAACFFVVLYNKCIRFLVLARYIGRGRKTSCLCVPITGEIYPDFFFSGFFFFLFSCFCRGFRTPGRPSPSLGRTNVKS